MEVQVVRRICDQCGNEQEFNAAHPPSAETIARFNSWVGIIRMSIGQRQPDVKTLCSSTCAHSFITADDARLTAEHAVAEAAEKEFKSKRLNPVGGGLNG